MQERDERDLGRLVLVEGRSQLRVIGLRRSASNAVVSPSALQGPQGRVEAAGPRSERPRVAVLADDSPEFRGQDRSRVGVTG